MSQQPGGSSWSRAAILAVAIAVLTFIPAVRTLITMILEGLK